MSKFDLSDVVFLVGLVLLAIGLAAYDWRLALVVCGALLLILGLWGTYRRGRTG